jgi:hypothetical protein
VDRYFLEHRAKVIDVAAFLDRVDRATPDADDRGEDFRIRSLRGAIAILLDGEGDRAKRVLDLLSDPSSDPIDTAPMKGATGAWEGFTAGTPANREGSGA